VLIDWSQNDPHKTTASVYGLRAKELPTASTPLEWEEVEAAAEAATRRHWSSRSMTCAARIAAKATSTRHF